LTQAYLCVYNPTWTFSQALFGGLRARRVVRSHLIRASRVLLLVSSQLLTLPIPAMAVSCPAGTFQIGEDDKTLYCKRENDAVGDGQATRAAILRQAMAKLGYPYHKINGRCLDGDVAMCPTGEHPGGCYDCSALVYDVLRSVGQPVTPNAQHQYSYFASIPDGLKHESPIYGDLVFFRNEQGQVGHVGIYVGSRAGSIYYLHSPGKGRTVTVSHTTRQPYAYGNVSVLKVKKPLN
jgi:NlpC/P60 family protein